MGDKERTPPTQLIRLRGSCYGDSEVALRVEGVHRVDDELQLTNCVRVLICNGAIRAVGQKTRRFVLGLRNVANPELFPLRQPTLAMEIPCRTAV